MMDEVSPAESRRNVVTLPGAGRREAVLGVNQTYLLEEQRSGGTLTCVELTVPPGQGVPPHTHHLEDETFYVLDGTVEITGDDLPAPILLAVGGLFHGPRGRMHGFRNAGQTPTRLLVFATPGGNLQKMFGELADLTSHSEGMPSPQRVVELCARYNIFFAPPPAD
ncbi:MAG: cupin domain-containing protein [Rhodospirillales bacterium]|nr:cupin domain-containing protein [Rhodospirillales bacterium]MBN8925473.1 cupin domain-containing protein [Rhodospirillales bacterium]